MHSNDHTTLFGLTEAVRQLEEGKRVTFDFDSLPETMSAELSNLKAELRKLAGQYNDHYEFILNLGRGNLEIVPPVRNNFSNPYKQLQADLLHLTWQIQQISEGDLDQKVLFSGDFSRAINKMIESLREKRRMNEQNLAYLEELKELNTMKNKFFSIIAHDLKNPFTGFLTLSDLMLENIREGKYEQLEECATLLKDFSTQGYRLLVNLLEWARLQTDSIKINLEPLSLATMVEESKVTILPRARQKNIAITCSCPGDYTVIADTYLLNTVLRNLLSNAVKFTHEQGCVRIWGEESDTTVTVHVEDNGVGISPETVAKLFRLDTNNSTKGTADEEGTGLGLILCKDFVEKMNGRIWVNSEPGKGTTISFSLQKA